MIREPAGLAPNSSVSVTTEASVINFASLKSDPIDFVVRLFSFLLDVTFSGLIGAASFIFLYLLYLNWYRQIEARLLF
jgi:hypothetical protein